MLPCVNCRSVKGSFIFTSYETKTVIRSNVMSIKAKKTKKCIK